MKYATCVASRFWLGTQRNKGMWGQRNSEEIEAGAMRNCLHGRVAFLSGPNACINTSFHLDQNVHPPIKYLVISHGRTDWTNLLRKTTKKKPNKRWQERCQSWIFDGKTGQLYWSLNRKWPFKSFFIEEMLWQFCPHQKSVWSQFHRWKVL